jgi:integrase/recombinase XerD
VSYFLDREQGLSSNTLAAYRADLSVLARWCGERKLPMLRTTSADLKEFLAWRVRTGSRPNSIARQVYSSRRFFRYFLREGVIHEDPTARIAMPRVRRAPPRSLTQEEVDALLSAPVVSNPMGHRDRTMLEVLRATGLRVSELVNLRRGHVKRGVIRILGKRPIPLDKRAIRALKAFSGSVRKEILADRRSDYLFPTRQCDRMSRQAFWRIIKRYARKAGMDVSPRTLARGH